MLARLAAYEARTIGVDGLDYHEALQAVGIAGGIAGNVIPDRCVVTVNYRYAPDKDGRRRRRTCARCSPASTSTSSTTRLVPAPA